MQDTNHPLLVVPGWGGSGPAHWQTTWQHELAASRVELDDWFDPSRDIWIAALDRAVAELARHDPRPPVLVAHSLGCIVVARWALATRRTIRAALLVAPADVEQAPCLPTLRDFGPVPRDRLPFASLVVTSDDDPYVSASRAYMFASWWGSDFHVVHAGGHLNADSGLGSWSAGKQLLESIAA